jgi:hypothetical protein
MAASFQHPVGTAHGGGGRHGGGVKICEKVMKNGGEISKIGENVAMARRRAKI